jgi:hypothetical protein
VVLPGEATNAAQAAFHLNLDSHGLKAVASTVASLSEANMRLVVCKTDNDAARQKMVVGRESGAIGGVAWTLAEDMAMNMVFLQPGYRGTNQIRFPVEA